MQKYTPIIGLEIHVQLNTKSKMFCSCKREYFGSEPNTHTCPVCLGLPGALPVPNKEAIRKVIMTGLATNCTIRESSKFDRKNYFYPDLPKGYQISQFDMPFCEDGYIEIDSDGDNTRVRITRIHLEEDTAKTVYEGSKSYIDFNKSCTPLMEIVTEPDFTTSKQVDLFSKKLKQIIEYIDASDANMEMGHIRFELNISLKKEGEEGLPNYKVEVKNIGSISFLTKAIEYEIKRHTKLLNQGTTPDQETRGFNDKSSKTISQRSKEGSEDYRYFPEPDIPPINLRPEFLQSIEDTIPELPESIINRLVSEHGISIETAEAIVTEKERSAYFMELIELAVQDKEEDTGKLVLELSKWFTGAFRSIMKVYPSYDYAQNRYEPARLLFLIKSMLDGKISGQIAKDILEKSFVTDTDPEIIIKEEGLEQISDESALEKIIEDVIANNAEVAKESTESPKVIGFLVGQVMKDTKGKANPKTADKLLREKLGIS